MVAIKNPFYGQDPVAKVLADLGQSAFGGTLDRDVKSEQLYKLQRENQETDNLMGLVNGSSAASLASSPVAQAMILGSGYKPEDFGKLGLLETATTRGARDPMTQNFQVGTGQSYDNTFGAFDAKLAETIRNNNMTDSTERYKFDNTLEEALINGNPQYVPRSEAPGMTPVLSNTDVQGSMALNNFGQMGDLPSAEQDYLGIGSGSGTAKTPKNYVGPDRKTYITYDGVNDAQTGAPLPPGGYIAGVQGGAADALGANALTTQSTNDDQGTIRRVEEYQSISQQLRQMAETAPQNFGALGMLRGNLQEAAQLVPALGALFGGDVNATVKDFEQSLIGDPNKAGMFNEFLSTYDAGLPTVRTLGVMAKYQLIAAALGQNGRDLSDKDLVQGEKLFPDPQGLFSSAQSVIATLDLFDRLMAGKKEGAVARLNAGSIQPGAMPVPAAPVVDPNQPQEGDTATGPNGQKIVLRNGQWVPL